MTKSERRPLMMEFTPPAEAEKDRRSSRFGKGGELRRQLKAALQNPLTFVFLVWAAMFAIIVLFFALID